MVTKEGGRAQLSQIFCSSTSRGDGKCRRMLRCPMGVRKSRMPARMEQPSQTMELSSESPPSLLGSGNVLPSTHACFSTPNSSNGIAGGSNCFCTDTSGRTLTNGPEDTRDEEDVHKITSSPRIPRLTSQDMFYIYPKIYDWYWIALLNLFLSRDLDAEISVLRKL